jgi:hypothetical protein
MGRIGKTLGDKAGVYLTDHGVRKRGANWIEGLLYEAASAAVASEA